MAPVIKGFISKQAPKVFNLCAKKGSGNQEVFRQVENIPQDIFLQLIK
jgi:hypothetical protein